jgi:diguanylate cyclase (GGDEF)-like protein
MDDALRRLERGDDPVAYSAALRRAGDEVRARRVLEQAVRDGHAGAREALDREWPVDERVRQRIDDALIAEPGVRSRNTVAWVAFEEDPRLEPGIAELARRCEGRTDWAAEGELLSVVRALPDERRRRLLDECTGRAHCFDGFSERAFEWLARARLDADEVADLVRHARAPGVTRGMRLEALRFASRLPPRNAMDALRDLARGDDLIVALDAILALGNLGEHRPPPTPLLVHPHATRPAWADSALAIAARDPLTGALRRYAISHVVSTGWVLLVDLDRLMTVNDVHGHRVADDVLAGVASALQDLVGDRVVRWSGDEFVVRLEPELDGPDVAERLREAIAAMEVATGVRVTASIGVVRATARIEDSIRAADDACLAAKRAGRNRVVVA